MKKRFLTLLLVSAIAVVSLTGCGTDTPAKKTTKEASTKIEQPYKISVIIKATDSDYWQTLLLGAKAAEKDNKGKVVVTTDGPPSEINIDKQVSILENVIATKPAGIVIASTSTDATVPAVEEAMGNGIPVITIDNKLTTDKYTSFLATDHSKAAGMAATAMVNDWKKMKIDLTGKKVIVISSVAGTKVNGDRTEGFIKKIKELVPGIKVLETQYADNDITKALNITQNTISANPDLIGIFGDNNHMGVGIAKGLEEAKKQNSIVAYAFDADADEVAALKNGVLRGLVVQDPFGMGYQGVIAAINAIEGKKVEKDVIVEATIISKENMNEEKNKKLLNPTGK